MQSFDYFIVLVTGLPSMIIGLIINTGLSKKVKNIKNNNMEGFLKNKKKYLVQIYKDIKWSAKEMDDRDSKKMIQLAREGTYPRTRKSQSHKQLLLLFSLKTV